MARKRNRTADLPPPEIEGFEDVFRTGLSRDQVEFLFAYIQHGSIISAARESEFDRSRHYEWMRTRLYAECFASARKHILGALETEAERRAMDGVIEPVFGKDGLLGKRRRYSDSLLVKLLEANGPEKYAPTAEAKNQTSAPKIKVNVYIPDNRREARRESDENV